MFLDGCTPELVTLIKMVKLALGIIQIVVPILLIVMGSLDLAKAVATQDDKVMKSTMATLGKRVVFAVAVFLVVVIVQLVMNMVSTNVQNSGSDTGLGTFTSCWNAA
jgi:hypothetical protein